MRHRRRNSQSNSLVCEELEPRLLLSADLVGVAVDLIPNDTGQADDETDLQVIEAALQTDTQTQSVLPDPTTRELVIIDPATPDYQSLLDDLISRDSGGRGFEVVLLDTDGNGIDQLSEILAEYRGLDAIHLISHGGEGEIRLGDANLDLETLQQSADRITAWGEALSLEGDWLFYGCDIAATASGERFIEQFAALTGADAAASDDTTGHTASGGDWQLEYSVGSIETAIAFSRPLQTSWSGTLDIVTGLVGHYTFDEGSGGTAFDSSATGNHGSLVGGPVYTTGQVGSHALSFNADFDRVEAADSAATNFGVGDFTVAFWFNSTYSGSTARLLGDMDGGDGYVFYTTGVGDITFQVSSGVDSVVLTAGGLFDGNWHHVVGTVSGADWMLYVDNGLADTVNNPFVGSIDNFNTLRIGASSPSHNEYDGAIDEIRLYNRAFTPTDVSELFLDANDSPVLDSASLSINEGETVTLTGANFVVTDPEDSSFTYTVSSVSGGYFQLSSNPGVSVTSFTTANLNGNLVQFVDDDNEVAPGFSVRVNDGVSDSNTLAATISYTPINDAPGVTNLDGDIRNYTEGDGVVLLEQGGDVVVSDPDSGNFAGGSLTVEVDSGLQAAEDVYSIFNQGTASGEIGFDGSDVTYCGVVIGSVTGGTGTDPLTVALNSNSSPAAVTALIRNITYQNSNIDNPTDGSRSVTIDITDGDGGASVTQNLTLNVSSVNDAPVVDLNGSDGAGTDFAVTFTEDAGAVNLVDADATISDAETTLYENLSINLSNFLDGGSEQIVIAGYTFSYGSADTVTRSVGGTSFVIDFDGSGFNVMPDGPGWMPEADLQTLLRGVTYENISQDPTAGDRTVNIFVQDSSLLTGPIATSTITVNPQNDSPTATDNTNSVSESGFVSGNVITDDSGSGVDSDPEGDGLQVTQVEGGAYTPGLPVTLASGAQVTFQPNGSYTYNTNGQFDGLGAGSSVDDSFTYQISDGNGGFATATVTITINGSNNAPVITSAGLTLDEGQTVTLSDTDFAITDADDTAFTYTVTGVTGGYFQLSTNPGVSITNFTSVNLTGGLVQFVDDGNEVAPAFSVTANDGDTDSNTLAATINFTLVSDSTPIANADSIAVAEGGTASTLVGGSSTVLNNDTGLGDTPVTVSLVTDVVNGTLTLNGDGTFSYTHDGSENFTDSFTYRITDNDGETADATVTINVMPVSDQTPVANADSITVAEGGTASTLVGGSSSVLNNDSGLGDTPVTVSLVTDVTNGALTLNGDGTFSYIHDGSENFTDSFTYRITDTDGETADATVTINVTPVSDQTPVANADSITVAEGGTASTLVGGSSTVLNNDTGLGDTPVTVSLVTDVVNGTLTLNGDGTFSYTHDGSENFTDSFTYRITDNDGETADATVTINVTPVSDQTPVANADSITVAEGGTATALIGGSSTVLNNDTGLGDTPVTVSLVTDVTNGTLTLNGDGTFSYTHDGSENFTDSFTYRITDNDGETADATVTINVTPVSDQTPVANADSITVAEGGTASTLVGGSSTVLNNDTGLGDTPVTVSLVTDVVNGTLTLNGDGTFSYTHDGSENFTDSFTYRITDNDGETADATVIIDIVSTNSSPEASDTDFSVLEDTVYTGNLPTASDGDGDTVIYQLENGPAYGSATVDANGRFSYTPDSDYHGADSFNYSVSDGNGGYNSYLVEIDVVAANDSPVITSHGENENVFLALEENTVIVTTVVADDPDNDDVSFAIDGGTDLGLFSIDPASGELVFINAPDTENPLDSDQDNLYQVQVLVADGNGGTDRQTFTIEVTDVDEFDVGLLIDTEETPDTISQSDSLHDGIGITVWAEDPDSSNNQITYSLDDDSNGLFSIDPSSGVVALASAVENRDASQFEITVRATSADGSYTLKSFIISLNNLIELPPEPEEPYLDDIIYELGPVEPDSPVSAHPEETMAHSTVPTAVDGVTESIQTREVSDALIQSVEEYPTQGVTETGRDAIDRFDKSLFSTEGRSSHSLGFMQMRFTPAPVSPDELPLIYTLSDELVEVPDTIWNLLDSMNQDMSDHRNEQASSDGVVLQSATFGTLALSAGYVAWLLRAGVLSASLLSFSPLWRQVDPLPVLSAHAKRRDEKQDRLKEDDPDEKRLAKLFDRKRKPKHRSSLFPGKDA
ncbi:MAG: tandem-95 repeat protein [Candidatus Thiodiazotropha sp. (ex Ctena orbiculata)]|nr:tandem-95 repeat protein [Candidatus Thiodiazotropha taylori]MBT2999350.1 tandem-95 repeat protein [Candidatus Thiodiazotropha taylori]